MRTHISKALRMRSRAIQTVLAAYNQAASALEQPHPKLTWHKIVEYTTIAEFKLLRSGARQDIRKLPWADARNREATVCHLKLRRAQEEIHRLNIEIKCLATWIADETQELDTALAKCQAEELLTPALHTFVLARKCINQRLRCTLEQIYALQGYTGDNSVGSKEELSASGFGDDGKSDGSGDEEVEILDNIFEGIVRLSQD